MSENRGLVQVWWIFVVIAAALAGWLAVPSSFLVQPVSVSLRGDQLTISRSTPFGSVTVNWLGEIALLDGRENYECTGSGTSIIQQQPDGIYTGTIGPWAKPCLDAGAPFVLRFRYQALLFGLIPLRPVYFGTTVQGP